MRNVAGDLTIYLESTHSFSATIVILNLYNSLFLFPLSAGDDNYYPVPTSVEGPSPIGSSGPSIDDDKNLWLFNVANDPIELFDLSATMPGKVRTMLDMLKAYNATAVPPTYPPSDPKCDPMSHGGFWGPWE